MVVTWKWRAGGLIALVVVLCVVVGTLADGQRRAVSVAPGDLVRPGLRKVGDLRPSCTVGYVDSRVVVTAGHCFDEGERVYTEYGEVVGNAHIIMGRDLAVVRRGVLSAGGLRTQRVDRGLSRGERVCMSSRVSGEVSCGRVTGGDADTLRIEPALEGRPGDSGSEVRSDGGIVGIYTGVVESDSGKPLYSTAARL